MAHVQDPSEMNNLYGAEGYEEITASLEEELARLQELYDDPVRFGYNKAREQ